MTSERSDFLLGKASQFYRVGKTLTQAIIKLLLKTHDVHVPINYIATREDYILLIYPVRVKFCGKMDELQRELF